MVDMTKAFCVLCNDSVTSRSKIIASYGESSALYVIEWKSNEIEKKMLRALKDASAIRVESQPKYGCDLPLLQTAPDRS